MKLIQYSKTFYRGLKKTFYKAKKIQLSVADPDFKIFKNIEFKNVKPEDIKDTKRLNYLRVLILSDKGYVNNSINSLISHYKLKDQYHNKNAVINPVGNIKALDDGKLRKHAIVGFDKSDGSYKISVNNIDYIPIWKPLNQSVIEQHFSKIYAENDNKLSLNFDFFKHDVAHFDANLKRDILANFNSTALSVFNSNPRFKKNIKTLSLEDIKSSSIGKSFSFSFDNDHEPKVYQIKDLTNDYVSIKPLFDSNDNQVKILSISEIKEAINRNGITIVANLDHDLMLGQNNGKLFIGHTKTVNGDSKVFWSSYEDFKNNDAITQSTKSYVSKTVIIDKNFLNENNKIVLKNPNGTAVVKEHYSSKKLYFGLNSNKSTNFKPIDSKLHQYIVNNFKNDPNFKAYLKLKPIVNNKINSISFAQ